MKKLLIAVALFAIGFVVGRFHTASVYAQSSVPAYACQTANGTINPCTQYVISVTNARLGGRTVTIYQMPSAVDVSSGTITASSYLEDNVSSQQNLPASSSQTFTIEVSTP